MSTETPTDELVARWSRIAAKAKDLRERGEGPWRYDPDGARMTPPAIGPLPEIPEERKWWNR